MSNTIINCPRTTTTTRYLYGTYEVVEKEFNKAKTKGRIDIRGHFSDDHVHMKFERATKLGRLVIDWMIVEEGEQPKPVYTVYTAIGSFPRYIRLVAINEAKDIILSNESSWATIVGPDGKEMHYRKTEDGSIVRMLNVLGGNPEYEELSKALDALQVL